jgi:outer membrane protein OmpA-like peptidoglycan-associated protein
MVRAQSIILHVAIAFCVSSCASVLPEREPEPAPISEIVAGAVVAPQHQQADIKRRKQKLAGDESVALPAEDVGFYMDLQEAKFRQRLGDSDVEVIRAGDSITLRMPGRISFAFNSARLDSEFKPLLAEISSVLIEFDKTLVSVHAHTDNVGAEEHNQRLSEQRGQSVARYFFDDGLSIDRLVVLGHGETRPIASNEAEDGRELNRRVELVLEPVTP